MSSDFAIRVDRVSKHHLIFARPEDRLKQMILPRVQRLMGHEAGQYYKLYRALEDVTFDVKRGETIGLIGRNGSGKSTLINLLQGVSEPSSGHVEVTGRVHGMQLGVGFDPEFTGLENIENNALISGL